jgi:ElaB/YqjD/DUF883 family membrane-anchored ribosome-binding protein
MDQRSESMNPISSPENREYGSNARSGSLTFDSIQEVVADKLHTAASTLREKAGGQRGGHDSVIAGYGQRAADWLDRSADYARTTDPQQVKADLENQVRHYPGRSLLIAGAAGLILGALFRRR